jgi:hypothetical protein
MGNNMTFVEACELVAMISFGFLVTIIALYLLKELMPLILLVIIGTFSFFKNLLNKF